MLNVEASILDHRQFAALRSRETKIFTSGPYVIDHEAIETELGLVNVIIDKRGLRSYLVKRLGLAETADEARMTMRFIDNLTLSAVGNRLVKEVTMAHTAQKLLDLGWSVEKISRYIKITAFWLSAEETLNRVSGRKEVGKLLYGYPPLLYVDLPTHMSIHKDDFEEEFCLSLQHEIKHLEDMLQPGGKTEIARQQLLMYSLSTLAALTMCSITEGTVILSATLDPSFINKLMFVILGSPMACVGGLGAGTLAYIGFYSYLNKWEVRAREAETEVDLELKSLIDFRFEDSGVD